MKSDKENILKKVDHRDGMTVPDGFFDDFCRRMEGRLPYNEAAESTRILEAPRTLWQRVRPFAYMAAMFAGIWLMVQMFTMIGGSGVDFSVENNEVLSRALSDDNFVYEYIEDDINDREMMEEMYLDSISVDDMTPADSLDGAEH